MASHVSILDKITVKLVTSIYFYHAELLNNENCANSFIDYLKQALTASVADIISGSHDQQVIAIHEQLHRKGVVDKACGGKRM